MTTRDAVPVQTVKWLNLLSEKRIHVESGDVYEMPFGMSTRAGHFYPKGSLLFVHDKTSDTPFHEIGPRGYNWLCRTQFGISVWATLEQCIERGLLRKVTAKPEARVV